MDDEVDANQKRLEAVQGKREANIKNMVYLKS
jgi:hypothetical protein